MTKSNIYTLLIALESYVKQTTTPVLEEFLKGKATIIRTDNFSSSQHLKTDLTKKFNTCLDKEKKSGINEVDTKLWDDILDPVSMGLRQAL
jgi:hypothetical protein